MYATHFELDKLAILVEDGKFVLVKDPESYITTKDGWKKVEYSYPSYRMSELNAEKKLEQLINENFPGITFDSRKIKDGENNYVITAKSVNKRAFLKYLGPFVGGTFPRQTRNRKISISRMLEWTLGMPYASVQYESGQEVANNEFIGGILKFSGESVKPKEITDSAIIYSLDSEWTGWWDKDVIFGDLDVSDKMLFDYVKKLGIDSQGSRRDLLDRLGDHINATKEYKVHSIVGASNNGENFIIGPYGNGIETRNTPWGEIQLKLIDRNSVESIIQAEKDMMPDEAQFIIGSNLAYDMIGFRNTGFYIPGVDNSQPTTSQKVGFFRRMKVKGRDTIDIAALGLHAMPHTKNNKLATILSHGFGINLGKPSDYDDQIRDHLQMDMGYEPSRQRQLDYLAWDANGPLEFGKKYLENLVLISKMFGLRVTDAVTLDKAEAGNYAWDKEFYLRYGTVRTRLNDKDFSVQKIALNHLNRYNENTQSGFFENKVVTSRKKTMRNDVGVYKNVHLVHLSPYIKVMEPLILRSDAKQGYKYPDAAKVLQNMKEEENPTAKLMHALYLENFIRNPVLELDRFGMSGRKYRNTGSPSRSDADLYKDFYGVSMALLESRSKLTFFGGPHRYNKDGKEELQHITGIEKQINFLQMPNYSEEFILLSHPYDQKILEGKVSNLVMDGMAIDMGKGFALSVEKGRFAFYSDGLLYKQGLDVDSSKGYKNFWEKEVLPEFIRLGYEGKVQEAKDFLTESCNLARGYPMDKFEFVTNAGRDADDYSIRAKVQRRVKLIEEMNALRGQEVRETLKDRKEFYSRFGSPGKYGTLFDGTIGLFARAVIPGLTHSEFQSIITGVQGKIDL
jgi:hypothetical protein